MATLDRLGATVDATDAPSSSTPNAGLAIKTAVRVATTGANIALSGLQTIDGVTLNAGDRVLVKDQIDQTTNGIYNASSGNWAASSDFQNNTQLAQGTQVTVTAGSTNINSVWQLSAANPVVLGTSLITFICMIGSSMPAPGVLRVKPLNVMDFGAVGYNPASPPAALPDDTAYFARAVAAANATGGNQIIVPRAFYCSGGVNDGTTAVYFAGTIDGNGLPFGSSITVGSNDVMVLALNNQRSMVERLTFQGYQSLSASRPTVLMAGAETVLRDCRIKGGNSAISITGSDCVLEDVKPSQAFGPALINGGGFLRRVKADQPFPSPPFGTAIGTWSAELLVVTSAYCYVNGALCQAVTGGTTGATVPPINLLANFTDGSVTWKYWAPETYVAVNSGGTFEQCDFSGPYSAGVAGNITGSVFSQCVFSCINHGIWASDVGNDINITSCRFNPGGWAPGSTAILLDTPFLGDTVITGNTILNVATGIAINGGTNTRVRDNGVFAATVGVSVAADICDFRIPDNFFNSTTWGMPTTGVLINGGSGDRYTVTGNGFHGLSTGLSDGGSGSNKTVSPNY